MVRKITFLLFCCLIVAIALLATNCSPTNLTTGSVNQTTEPDGNQLPAPGRTAPDFELQNLEGQIVSLSDYRGSPVMLNFWASWCSPCRFEMPFIQDVFEDTEWEAVGLVILAVNIGESPSVAGGFMEDNGFTFTVLLDETGEVSIRYNTRSIPATFFIDENGIIRYIDVGAFSSKANIEQRLDVLIEDESQGS